MTDRQKSYLVLAGVLVLTLALSFGVSNLTRPEVDGWYQSLIKPPMVPPDYVFGVTWTILYTLMSVAAWRAWRAAGGTAGDALLKLYFLHLGLNFIWPVLFFTLGFILVSLLEIIVLLAVIVYMQRRFAAVDGVAGVLLLPYIAWVSFATYMTAGFLILNP